MLVQRQQVGLEHECQWPPVVWMGRQLTGSNLTAEQPFQLSPALPNSFVNKLDNKPAKPAHCPKVFEMSNWGVEWGTRKHGEDDYSGEVQQTGN